MRSAEILRHSPSSRAPSVSEWPGRRRKAPSTITALALISWSSSALEHGGRPALLQGEPQPLGLQARRVGLGLVMGLERVDDILARRRQRLGQEAEALELGATRCLQELVDIDRPQIARQAEAAGFDEARFQPQQLGQHLGIGLGEGHKLGQPALRAAVARRAEGIDHGGARHRAVAEGSRRMTRSPASAPTFSSSTSCASAASPGASLSPSSSATRPMTWAAPR